MVWLAPRREQAPWRLSRLRDRAVEAEDALAAVGVRVVMRLKRTTPWRLSRLRVNARPVCS
jgi:hypothetical protein